MSLSFSNWKNIFTGQNSDRKATKNKSIKAAILEDLEPEVGFRLSLDPIGSSHQNYSNQNHTNLSTSSSFTEKQQNVNIPELNVHIIGARHLPTLFGIKSVKGYLIKVKLFPGTIRYDSSIQTNSWPKFNETFKFPMGTTLKSSIRTRSKDACLARTLPEKLFKGHFVVFTVFALLELPPDVVNPIKEKYQSFVRKGSILLKEKKIIKTSEKDENIVDKEKEDKDKNAVNLTNSESRRNIGSVTCFLDPKIFIENSRNRHFCTEEMWMPIKDITHSTPASAYQKKSSPKGQIEVTLQLCQEENLDCSPSPQKQNTNPFDDDETNDTDAVKNRNSHKVLRQLSNSEPKTPTTPTTPTKSGWGLVDVKNIIKNRKKDKNSNSGTCLKITISRMRCSIKVKEEFENIAGEEIYLKMTVFERDIFSSSWKSKTFAPSLSTRFDHSESTIIIPIVNDYDIDYVSVKISVATKPKVGKKIFLGTLTLGPDSTDHWKDMIHCKGFPSTKWHNFE